LNDVLDIQRGDRTIANEAAFYSPSRNYVLDSASGDLLGWTLLYMYGGPTVDRENLLAKLTPALTENQLNNLAYIAGIDTIVENPQQNN